MMFPSRRVLIVQVLLGLAFLAIVALAEGSLRSTKEEEVEVTISSDNNINSNNNNNNNNIPIESSLQHNDVVPSPVEIPNFEEGGVLVFFHLYKTGGTSVWGLMNKHRNKEHLDFNYSRDLMTEEDINESVDMAKKEKKAVVYVFHTEYPNTMYPTLVEAAPILDNWRKHAESNGIPFFAATTVREPMVHSLSFFNFFHVAMEQSEDSWTPFQGDMEPTEENFLKTYVPNRICHLMADDAHGIFEAPEYALREGVLEKMHHFMDENELNRRNEPSKCDIDKVRATLFSSGTFDYVGVTERLSTHILPLFMEIIFGDPQLAGIARVAKTTDFIFDSHSKTDPLRMDALSDSTKEKVANESALDQQIYKEALERFANWPSYNISINEAAATTDRTDEDDSESESEDDSEDEDEDDSEDADADADDYEEEL